MGLKDKPTNKNLPTKHGGFNLKHCGTYMGKNPWGYNTG